MGGTLLALTLALYAAYLVWLEDIRLRLLDGEYGLQQCYVPPVDTLIDSAFEYSILANLLVVAGCVSCTRWLLVPWLVVYTINILLLLVLSLILFLVPPPSLVENNNKELVRLLGLGPVVVALLLLAAWLLIRARFVAMGAAEEKAEEGEPCRVGVRLKTTVQLAGGGLALASGVMLVLFFAQLDDLIRRQYFAMFEAELSRAALTGMAGAILLSILVNILLLLGAAGGRWRRVLVLPWLLFYGAAVVCCLLAHLYFTSLCWREEKVVGMVCLGAAFLLLGLWAAVWTVAAQLTDRPRQLISVPGNTAFQRL